MVQATEKSHLVQVLSSGYVNFIQVYDAMHGFIFVSEFAENEIFACQMSKIHAPGVVILETFIHNLCILFNHVG